MTIKDFDTKKVILEDQYKSDEYETMTLYFIAPKEWLEGLYEKVHCPFQVRSASMDTTESILTSVKKLLGIDESYTHFDADLIMHINSVFSILGQMGVGPKKGFAISGADEKWSDFLEDDPGRLALVKSYMHLKVRLLFDLPTASSAVDAMNRQISEFEWRLFVAADNAAREEESQNG